MCYFFPYYLGKFFIAYCFFIFIVWTYLYKWKKSDIYIKWIPKSKFLVFFSPLNLEFSYWKDGSY